MPRLQPEQSYYPSARVRLILRLEDYGDPKTPSPLPTLPQLRSGTGKNQDQALEVRDVDGVLVLVQPGDDPTQLGTPHEQHASLDGYTHVIDGIVPSTAGLGLNGIRTADTLHLDLKFRDLPIDPRTVRACGIEFFLGCVAAEDFHLGMTGQLRDGSAIPLNVIPDTYLDRYGRPRTNLRFQGWVDDWVCDWPGDGATVVSLDCTDNTRLLIDQDHPPKLSIPIDAPIDQAVAQYLANFPQFRGLRVEYRPIGAERPVLGQVLTKQAYPNGVGPSAATGGDSKLNCWDYLTDVIGSIGLTVRMQGTTIVIQRARTLYANKFSGREDDPFRGRILPGGRELSRRLFIYGHNIESMSPRRNFTKNSPTNVEVRCYNGKRKKTLIARYPTFVASKQKKLLPGESSETKYTVVRVTGIEDEATLRVIAQTSYETQGRKELEFDITTKNLASMGGDNLDPDLFDMQEGDAIDIEVQRADQNRNQNEITFIEEQLATRPVQFLLDLGFPEPFAQAYAAAVQNIAFPVTFRVKSIDVDWDADSEGVAFGIHAINYVEARVDTELPQGEETEPEPVEAPPPLVVVNDF